jgi:hypothetical protein
MRNRQMGDVRSETGLGKGDAVAGSHQDVEQTYHTTVNIDTE